MPLRSPFPSMICFQRAHLISCPLGAASWHDPDSGPPPRAYLSGLLLSLWPEKKSPAELEMFAFMASGTWGRSQGSDTSLNYREGKVSHQVRKKVGTRRGHTRKSTAYKCQLHLFTPEQEPALAGCLLKRVSVALAIAPGPGAGCLADGP